MHGRLLEHVLLRVILLLLLLRGLVVRLLLLLLLVRHVQSAHVWPIDRLLQLVVARGDAGVLKLLVLLLRVVQILK